MDVLTSNPMMLGLFVVVMIVLVIAGVVRMGMNVHDDIEDWQEEREAEEQKKRGEQGK